MHGEHGTAELPAIAAKTVPRNRLFGFLNQSISTGLAALTVSTLAACTLAACTGDPAPVGTVPNGSPTSASPSPTIAEPVRPIDKPTPESAIQFTRYFWDLYNYAYQTYDTAPLKAISDPKCKFCQSAINGANTDLANSTRTEGADIKVVELASPPVKITTGTSVVCVLRQTAGKAIPTTGETTAIPAIPRIRSTLGLQWTPDGWIVHGVEYQVQK